MLWNMTFIEVLLLDRRRKRTMQVARHSETAETKEREHQNRSTCFSKMTNREQGPLASARRHSTKRLDHREVFPS
jgi:hypothetical protein